MKIDMNSEHAALMLFKQRADDVRLIYGLYCDYVFGRIMETPPYKIPDTFTLVCAFASVFDGLKPVSGYTGFITAIDREANEMEYKEQIHHWLVFRDFPLENKTYLIDVIPADGKFSVSVPQAVIQDNTKKRFFPLKSLYPKSFGWSNQEVVAFSSRVDSLVETLKMLMQKVPF